MAEQNSTENQVQGICPPCGKPAGINVCSSCRRETYCSRECQVKDWKVHKKACIASEVAVSDELGRHLIAARNLKAGDLIITESAAICAPSNQNQNPFVPPCLSCFEPTPNKCSKCFWPICSVKCGKAKNHAENECSIVAEHKLKYDSNEEPDDMQVLRMCLVKEKDPELWTKILDLQHESTIPSSSNEGASITLEEKGVRAREKFRLTEKVTNDEWLRMHRTSRISGFLIDLSKEKKQEIDTMGSFLFLESSMFSHACSPNCYYEVTESPNFRISVRASVNIIKGTPLTILYNAGTKLCGTLKRRQDLLESAGFLCKCERCCDKTELGSFMSGINCFACKDVVLPKDPLNPTTSWECSRPGCRFAFRPDQVAEIDARIHGTIKRWLDMEQYSKLCAEVETAKEFLHPNHWILVGAYRGILAILSRAISRTGGTPEQRKDYYDYAVKMLSILDLVNPGISHQAAGLKMSLSALALENIQVKMEAKMINLEQFNNEMENISKWQAEALLYFKNETIVTDGVMVHGPNALSLLECIEYQKHVKQRYNRA